MDTQLINYVLPIRVERSVSRCVSLLGYNSHAMFEIDAAWPITTNTEEIYSVEQTGKISYIPRGAHQPSLKCCSTVPCNLPLWSNGHTDCRSGWNYKKNQWHIAHINANTSFPSGKRSIPQISRGNVAKFSLIALKMHHWKGQSAIPVPILLDVL